MCLGFNLVWFGGLPEKEPEALHMVSKSSVTELYPQPCFVLFLSRETGSVVAKLSLNLLCGCLALNYPTISTSWDDVCVSRQFKQGFVYGGDAFYHAQSKMCAFS